MSTLGQLLDQYRDTGRQLKEAIAGLTAAELTWKEADDIWSVNEVVSHLTDHNVIVSFRIRHIIAEGTAPLPAFNQNRWVEASCTNGADVTEMLTLFDALLAYNAGLFRRLASEAWEMTGETVKGNKVRLYDAVEGFIAHLQTHLRQIKRIKSHYASLARTGSE